MAKVLGSIGRATKAIDVYHRVIKILESRSGVECEDLVVPLFNLANLFIKEGRNKDGEAQFMRLLFFPLQNNIQFILLFKVIDFITYPCFSRILSIYRNLYGENDGRFSMALCSLAHVKCSTG